jgi:uncharacterized RDD family membrane protein YckC
MNEPLHHTTAFTPLLRSEKLFQKRVMAFVLDLFLVVLGIKAMMMSYSHFLRKFTYPIYHQIRFELPYLMEVMEGLSFFLFYGSYFFLCLYLSQGKTIGKAMLGLKVVSKENLGELLWWQALSRTVGYYAGYFSGLLLFALPLTNKQGLGLQDWLSTTQVISEEQWREIQEYVASIERANTQKVRKLELLIVGQDDDLAA